VCGGVDSTSMCVLMLIELVCVCWCGGVDNTSVCVGVVVLIVQVLCVLVC
jgi:hypothetical protein